MKDGKMDPDHCAAFISKYIVNNIFNREHFYCIFDNCKGDDHRVKDIFTQMDSDNDGFLVLEDFLRFFTNASKTRQGTVWNNLQAHGYRNDLQSNEELADVEVDLQSLPRFILYTFRFYHKKSL